MVFDPPDVWWIRVGQATAVKLTEATKVEIQAELDEVSHRCNGYVMQGITTQSAPAVVRLWTELFALQVEIARRLSGGLKD